MLLVTLTECIPLILATATNPWTMFVCSLEIEELIIGFKADQPYWLRKGASFNLKSYTMATYSDRQPNLVNKCKL